MQILGAALAILVVAAGPLPAPSDPPIQKALDRLSLMPLEHRRELQKNMERFRVLPRSDQQRLEEIDRRLQEADPEVRARYLSVLRRYSTWIGSLPEAAQKEIRAAAPEDRMALVRKHLAENPIDPNRSIDTVLARASTLNQHPIFDQLHWIRAWYSLDADQRLELERLAGTDRMELLEKLAAENGVVDERPTLLKRFEQEAVKRFTEQGRSASGRVFEAMKPLAKKEMVVRFIEARYLQNMNPEPVEQANLERFVNSLPSWMREALSPLPPASAHSRLVLLYRLIFPVPAEVPENTVGLILEAREAPATPLKPRKQRESPVVTPNRKAPQSAGANPF